MFAAFSPNERFHRRSLSLRTALLSLALSLPVTTASVQAVNQNETNDRLQVEIRKFVSSFQTVGSRIIFTFIPANGPLSGRFAITGPSNETYPGNRCSQGHSGSAESCDNNGSDADPSPVGSDGRGNPDGGEPE